jgi:hypothetical protein
VRLTTAGRGCCARCGAWLRRARPRAAELCDPCRRVGPDPRRELPAGFYFQDPIVAALADYDFGFVFRRVRSITGWSQQTLGELVGLDQTRISEIERGVRRLRDVALVARVTTGLCIPPVLLGFGTTVGEEGIADPQVVNWVDRRDFVQHIAGLTFGVAGATGLDIDRLAALLPHADPTGTRHIGAADVETIEQATAAFTREDFARGSGLSRDAAVTHLRSVLPLLDAQASSEVRARLYIATADLAVQAGYMSFDVMQHDAARRLWMIGLNIARDAEDPRSNDLVVFCCMTWRYRQCIWVAPMRRCVWSTSATPPRQDRTQRRRPPLVAWRAFRRGPMPPRKMRWVATACWVRPSSSSAASIWRTRHRGVPGSMRRSSPATRALPSTR